MIPGIASGKPGYAGKPFFGIDCQLAAFHASASLEQGKGALVINRPWPGMARTVYGNHDRFVSAYLSEYPGKYFTGDGASIDPETQLIRIHGRIDDVINASGVRFSTGELEAVLTNHPQCSKAAVLGRPDPISGESIVAFCLLRSVDVDKEKITQELRDLVRSHIGPLAAPKQFYFPSDLPKTRSGKIMRRILRKLLHGEADQLGDLSTIVNIEVVEELKELINE